jgi:hypothetical protein
VLVVLLEPPQILPMQVLEEIQFLMQHLLPQRLVVLLQLAAAAGQIIMVQVIAAVLEAAVTFITPVPEAQAFLVKVMLVALDFQLLNTLPEVAAALALLVKPQLLLKAEMGVLVLLPQFLEQ